MPIGPSGVTGGGGASLLFHSQLGASATSIDTGANGIPATATNLLIVLRTRTDQVVTLSSALVRFNNDSGANYDRGGVSWNGAAVAFGSVYASTSLGMDSLGTTADANRFHVEQVLVVDYTDSSSFKQALAFETVFGTAADANVRVGQSAWTYKSTSAISRVAVLPGGGTNLVAGSSLTVYGLQ